MPEFQLYKKRNFSAYINDSIQFFKLYGKNYFKNYIIINGALLLLICALFYIVFKDLFSNMGHPTALNNWFLADGNIALAFFVFILFIIISIVSSILCLGQPISYVRLIEKSNKDEFTASEILQDIMTYAGRMFVFGLISFIVLLPIMFVFILIGTMLSLVLVGIPVLIIGIPALIVWSMQGLLVYIYEESGYFSAMKKAWKILMSNFWHIVGSSIVVYILISIAQSAFNMVPYFTMIGSIVSSGSEFKAPEFPPYLIFFYVAGILVSYISLNIFNILQTLIYYSAKEEKEHIQVLSDIENIGKNEL